MIIAVDVPFFCPFKFSLNFQMGTIVQWYYRFERLIDLIVIVTILIKNK
jgi:hypothetical protein